MDVQDFYAGYLRLVAVAAKVERVLLEAAAKGQPVPVEARRLAGDAGALARRVSAELALAASEARRRPVVDVQAAAARFAARHDGQATGAPAVPAT